MYSGRVGVVEESQSLENLLGPPGVCLLAIDHHLLQPLGEQHCTYPLERDSSQDTPCATTETLHGRLSPRTS